MQTRKRALSIILPVMGLALWCSPGGAEESSPLVAIWRITFSGETEALEGFRERLATALEQGVEKSGVGALDTRSFAKLLQEKWPAGLACDEVGCLKEAAEKLGVRVVIQGEVAQEGDDYQIKVAASEVSTGRTLLVQKTECLICTLDEAEMNLGSIAVRLGKAFIPVVRELSRPRMAKLVLRTVPGNAEAVLDGQEAGRTDLVLELAPGKHRLILRKEGYLIEEREVVMKAGGSQTLDVTLRKAPVKEPRQVSREEGAMEPPPVEETSTRSPWRPVFYGGMTGAVASGVAGGILVYLDGQSTCGGDHLQCPTLYDTARAGYVCLGVSAVLLGTSIWALTRTPGSPSPSTEKVSLWPEIRQGGLGLGLAARW